MAKRKDSKALFEVIKPGMGERSKPLGVPGWFGQAKPQAPGQARPATTPSSAAQPTATPPPAPRPMTAGPATPRSPEPLMQVADGKLRVSLNNVSAAVVVLGLVLVVIGAFFLGKRAGAGAVGSQGQGGSQNVPVVRQGDNAGQPAPGSGGGATENAAGNQRVKGYNYLIIASRIGNQAEAVAIRDFLHGKGVETTVEQMQDGTFCVKDLVPFRGQRDPKVEERKDAFAKLGAAYHAAGGSYNLSQPYLSLEK